MMDNLHSTMNNAQLPEGYKLTEVGVIPEDWDVKPLCNIAEIRSGIAKNSKVSVIDPIFVHYLRVANVQDGFLDLKDMSKIGVSRNDLKRYAVLPGDVLMNEGGDLDKLGRGSIWRGEFNPCIHQNHVFIVRSRSSLLPEYLNTWTSGISARRYFLVAGKQTTNLATINKTALGHLPVALPPLPEQRSLATVLSDTDALLGALDRLIAKKRDLKQATMQQLLTGKTRLPGFCEGKGYKQTEVGIIPEDWIVKPLGELGKFKNGINKGKDDFGHGFPFINLMDVFGIPKVSTSTTEFGLVNTTAAERDLYELRGGDVLFVRSSVKPEGVGLTTLIPQDLPSTVFSGFLIRFRECGLLELGFKEHCFWDEGFRARLISNSTVSANTNINQDALKRLQIAFPPTLPEQRSIATILSDMDSEITALEQRRDKTRALKQAMMQELLTGRIRLV
jgi:type I restriction enzyme, S subunit